jgi:nucleoside phosphorylase
LSHFRISIFIFCNIAHAPEMSTDHSHIPSEDSGRKGKGKEKELSSFPPIDYTVGWICAITTEFLSAKGMLDQEHAPLKSQNAQDKNSYILGRIGKYKIAIACLPEYGTVSTATSATMMQFTFPSLRFGLMVGIGGGIPSNKHDVRLRDIVVSLPDEKGGGVIQFDLGRKTKDGLERKGTLNKPPMLLRTAITKMRILYDLEEQITKEVTSAFRFFRKWAKEREYLGAENDVLFKAEYDHHLKEPVDRRSLSPYVQRPPRDTLDPRIHCGNLTSGNQVMKDAATRDSVGKTENVLCFEMEATGLMDNFPCLVIRGICDYADSYKNKEWQPYAAAVAAAYAKLLFLQIAPQAIEKQPPIRSVTSE